jgi:hypothetical protein
VLPYGNLCAAVGRFWSLDDGVSGFGIIGGIIGIRILWVGGE